MSWWNSGVWTGPYTFDDLAEVLHELCTALNEREKLLGMGESTDAWTPWYEAGGGSTPLTKFYIKDGTQKTFPTADDFRVSFIEQSTIANSSGYVALTLARLKAGVEALVTTGIPESSTVSGTTYHARYSAKYVSDIDTAYTLSSLLSLGSYGSSWVTVTRHNDPDIWDQIREALALLTMAGWCPLSGSPIDTNPNATLLRYCDEAKATAQETWDIARAASSVDDPKLIIGWAAHRWIMVIEEPEYFVSAALRNDLSVYLCTKYSCGTLDNAKLVMSLSKEHLSTSTESLTIDGNAYDESVAAGEKVEAWSPSVGGQTLITGDIGAEPATVPQELTYQFWWRLSVTTSVTFGSATRLTTDISAKLTYG